MPAASRPAGQSLSVLGTGLVAPPGHASAGALLEAMDRGERGAGAVNLLARWNASEHVRSKQLRRMSRLGTFVLAAGARALEAAGIAGKERGPLEDVGSVFATVHGATSYLVDFHRGFLKDGLPGAGPILFTNGVTNAPATHVSIEYSIRGRSLTLTGGALCAIEAIAAASSMLAGGCSAVLVSAGEEMLDLMAQTYGRFDAAAIPGRGKASPGAVPLCEGAAALVLGPGGGAGEFALEAWAFGSPSRDATGGEAAVEEAIRGCLDAAGLSPEAPDALVASLRGNGADAEELRGIAAAFRERRRPLPAAAPGANLGEGFAFQALLGVVAGLEVLRRGSVPPCALSPLPAPAGPLVFPDRPLRAPASLVLALHMDADRSASACLARRRG